MTHTEWQYKIWAFATLGELLNAERIIGKMGCNTSKESVQPVGDEAKEDVKNGGK